MKKIKKQAKSGSRVVTITFSPCIDKSTTVNALVPEKKLKCSEPKLEAGGGGINVARAIHKLGGQATAIYMAGGYTGKFLDMLVKKETIPHISIRSKNETRENLILVDEATDLQYRFGMPGSYLYKKEWRQLLDVIKQIKKIDYIVASGSLPPGVPDNIFARIAAIAKKKNARFILDTSGTPLREAVNKGVFLIKPNLGELCALVNKDHLKPDEVQAAACSVIREGRCEVIVVSMGEKGAMVVTKEMIKTIVPPRVEKKSTVGAGDSMVAGIVWALTKGMSLEESVAYGVAAGTAATMNPGTALCNIEDVERIFTGFDMLRINNKPRPREVQQAV